jgi:hypothetical protein
MTGHRPASPRLQEHWRPKIGRLADFSSGSRRRLGREIAEKIHAPEKNG